MYRLEEETDNDWWEVEALLDLCFAPGRTALSSYRLRDGVPMVASLCHVLRDAEGVIAAVLAPYGPCAVLLRPDRHVLAVIALAAPQTTLRALQQLLPA